MVSYFVYLYADSNAKYMVSAVFYFWILYTACSCEKCTGKAVKCINILGAHQAHIHQQNIAGETPVMSAIALGFEDAALALIKQGFSLEWVHADLMKPFNLCILLFVIC
jgi:hypothetical protein